jgi:diphosphomevalonate decarboxylase
MNYSERYIKNGSLNKILYKEYKGIVGWECPSNIALIKYWGKKEGQIPMNPSLSFTLSNSITKTTIRYEYDHTLEGTILEYYFEEQLNKVFENKVIKYLNNLCIYLPFLKRMKLVVRSGNTFPHSAGMASSASSFGAMALCLVSIECQLTGNHMQPEDFFSKVSFLARLGSGSASRSVYGGIVEWGRAVRPENSSDEIAISLDVRTNSIFKDYQDVVLLVDEGRKSVSSSEGHRLMLENPYSPVRYEQARKNLDSIISAMEKADLDRFIKIVENEALSLHSLMLTSDPGFFLVKQGTVDIIEKVRLYRNLTKVPVAFTLDAGANVHLLFPDAFSGEVMRFIKSELIQYCAGGKYICDKVGHGPGKIDTHEKV